MIVELGAFALVMALGQFSPGPDMLLLTRTALAEGLKAGWLTVVGIVTGLAFHATLAISGMAVLLAQGGWLAQVMKILAAGYLAWLAMGLLRQCFQKGGGEESSVKLANRSPYLRGLFCNLLNPKVAVFFAGAVSPFLAGTHPAWWPVVIWLVIVLEGFILWSFWVWFLQKPKIREGYRKAGRWIDGSFGIALLGLAIALLWR